MIPMNVKSADGRLRLQALIRAIPVLVLSSMLVMMFGGCQGPTHQFQIENATGEEVAVTSGHTQKTVSIPNQKTARVPHSGGDITVTMRDGKTWLYRNLDPWDLRGTPFLIETSSYVFGGSRTVNLLLHKNGRLYAILPDAKETDIEELKQPRGFPVEPAVGKRAAEHNGDAESAGMVGMDRARKQREAVEAIVKASGTVDYISSAEPLILEGMRAHFGTEFGDAEAAYLKGLTSLAILTLSGTQVTDAGLKHLKGLTGLVTLNLSGTQVTDAGLKHLKGLTSLVYLNLGDTQITDTGLEHLKGLTKLEYLYLFDTQVTDGGLEHLKGLPNLDNLILGGPQVTDAWLKHLKGMTILDRLHLDVTQVTDAGLEHLKGLTNLRYLSLRDTQVTDAGLEHLKGLTKLGYLDLNGTQVSRQGVERLRQALPYCGIYP